MNKMSSVPQPWSLYVMLWTR